MTTQAHATSLHLFEALEKSRHNASAEDALEDVNRCIETLGLGAHIRADTGIDGHVELESMSLKGSSILQEVQMRSNVPPCPPGDCVFNDDKICKWCGRKVV